MFSTAVLCLSMTLPVVEEPKPAPLVRMIHEAEKVVLRLPQKERDKFLGNLVEMLTTMGEFEEAQRLVKELRDDYDISVAHTAFAIFHARQKNYELAYQSFALTAKHPKLNYTKSQIWSELASLALWQEHFAECESIIQTQIPVPLDQIAPLIALAGGWLEQGDVKKADALGHTILKKIETMKFDPMDQWAVERKACWLTEAFLLTGQTAKANKNMGETLSLSGWESNWLRLAFYRSGLPAVQELLEIVRIKGTAYDHEEAEYSMVTLGEELLEQGRLGQAIVFSCVHSPDGEHYWRDSLLLGIARLQIERKQLAEAEKSTARIVEDSSRCEGFAALATAYHNAQNIDKRDHFLKQAKHSLNRYCKYYDTSKFRVDLYCLMARCEWRCENQQAARSLLKQALDILGDLSTVPIGFWEAGPLETVLETRIALGDFKDAEEMLRILWQRLMSEESDPSSFPHYSPFRKPVEYWVRLGKGEELVAHILKQNENHHILYFVAREQGKRQEQVRFPQWIHDLPSDETKCRVMIEFLNELVTKAHGFDIRTYDLLWTRIGIAYAF